MAFDPELSPEELVIRLKEATLRENVNGTWVCLAAMVIFGLLAIFVHAASSGSADQMLVFIMGFLCLLFAGLSAMSWGFVCRDRKIIAQLRALAASKGAAGQLGVWPPPPRATD